MAQPRHSDAEFDGRIAPEAPPADTSYSAGGQIAEMQANIARRLAMREAEPYRTLPEPVAERAVRLLSKGAGYLALLAGYGLIVFAFIHWL